MESSFSKRRALSSLGNINGGDLIRVIGYEPLVAAFVQQAKLEAHARTLELTDPMCLR
jgi:hypothetical protein